MESGMRWKDEDIPKSQWHLPDFLWFPAAELYGIQRVEYLDDVLVLSGAGVDGGSHVYANTLYVPPEAVLRRSGMGEHHRRGRRTGAPSRPGNATRASAASNAVATSGSAGPAPPTARARSAGPM
jgi:hypothetical protein